MDVIAVDIGNNTISLGAFTNEELGRNISVPVNETERLAHLFTELREFCGEQELGASTVPVVVSCVNQPALQLVERAVDEALDQRVFVIGKDIPLPIKVAVRQPETVGTDRLVSAAAAYDMLEQAVVVADFGTAITVDCVSEQGTFMGGAILPGLSTSAQSLNEHTSALPYVEPAHPEGYIGIDTVSAIQHGVYYGAIGAMRQLVERYAEQLCRWPHVVLTGGHADLIAKGCDFADSKIPTLCLTGIYLTYVKYRAAEDTDVIEDNQ